MLGTTLDDAAGEAFDKGARLLGLPYPGGAEIDRLARDGDPDGLRLPGRPRARARLLVLRAEDRAPLRRPRPRRRPSSSARRADLAASYQRAIVRALVERVEAAGAERVAIVGGVAANSELRASLPGRRRGAARALHRQRRDDRLGGPVHRPRPGRRVPCARCVCFGVLSSALARSRGDRRRGLADRPLARSAARRPPAPPAARRRGAGSSARRARRSTLGEPDDRRPADAVGRPAARARRSSRPRRPSAAGRPRPSPPSSRCSPSSPGTGSACGPTTATPACSTASRPCSTRARSRCSSTTPRSPASIPVRAAYPATIPLGAPRRRRRAAARRRAARASTARASRSRCSTPASTARTRTSAAASSRASTSSAAPATAAAQRDPQNRARRSSGTAPSSPGVLVGSGGPAASTASRRARPCCRSGSPAGSRPRAAATPSTRAATS